MAASVRNNHCLLLAIALLTVVMTAVSVRGAVTFSTSSYDFGTIREEAGKARGEVMMYNIGPGPTFIRNVRPTCGCTDVAFTEGMIEEGDSALITFRYDPEQRPGHFDKSIKVFVGQDNKMHVIRISGQVLASRQTIDTSYPDSIGELRLSSLLLDAGEIPSGEARNLFVNLYNPTDHPVRPAVTSPSEAVSVAVEPSVIEPYGTAVLGIYMTSRRETNKEKEIVYEIQVCSDADAFLSHKGVIRLRWERKEEDAGKTSL